MFFPTSSGGVQKWKLSRNMYTLRARFLHTWAPILYAQSVLIDNFFASQLSRMFIKGALLVGSTFSFQFPFLGNCEIAIDLRNSETVSFHLSLLLSLSLSLSLFLSLSLSLSLPISLWVHKKERHKDSVTANQLKQDSLFFCRLTPRRDT